MMTNDDYKNRRIKHRSTGEEYRVWYWIEDPIGGIIFIVLSDTNHLSLLSKHNVDHAFHILGKEAEVVFVDFPARRAAQIAAGEVA